jgi:hypothetical protein
LFHKYSISTGVGTYYYNKQIQSFDMNIPITTISTYISLGAYNTLSDEWFET